MTMTQTKNEAPTLDNGYILNARSDSVDFRDRMYQPALTALKRELYPTPEFIIIRDQGREGACTGFALAAVINYLNQTRQQAGIIDEAVPVSERMLYESAKRHDRWPGEDYDGSSARGTMKGWHKSGVCPSHLWEYHQNEPGFLTAQAQQAALENPIGAYYRIAKSRTEVQAALNEVPAIFATASVHDGWNSTSDGGVIGPNHPPNGGGHAFAIIGYTKRGFIIQNSWGESWGGLNINGTRQSGLAIWTYEDFDANLRDAWVARMALPATTLEALSGGSIAHTPTGPKRAESGPPQHQIMDHYVHIDNGRYDPQGNYPTFDSDVDRIVEKAVAADHVMLFAHGGLSSIKAAAKRTAKWRPVLERNGIYGIHFIWETGFFAELGDILFGKQDQAEARTGGPSDWWDTALEKLTHPLGHALWKEMQSDAETAFTNASGTPAGTDFITRFKAAFDQRPATDRPKLHAMGHSAGSIWMAHMLNTWSVKGSGGFENLILLAPTCTTALFNSHITPAADGGTIKNINQFIMTDEREQDDNVATIYRKSLLYLVSNSYQKTSSQLNGPGVPLVGMEKFLGGFNTGAMATHLAGDAAHANHTDSHSHGNFDNDKKTMNKVLKLILGHDGRPFEDDDLAGY